MGSLNVTVTLPGSAADAGESVNSPFSSVLAASSMLTAPTTGCCCPSDVYVTRRRRASTASLPIFHSFVSTASTQPVRVLVMVVTLECMAFSSGAKPSRLLTLLVTTLKAYILLPTSSCAGAPDFVLPVRRYSRSSMGSVQPSSALDISTTE